MQQKRKINLAGWIIICMLAGILVGFVFLILAPKSTFTTDYLKPIGTIYINLLKFMVVPVVLFSIMDGVISLNDLKRVGSVGVRTFIYYMCTTAIAVVIGLIVVNCFKGFFPVLDSSVRDSLEYAATEAPKVMDVIVGIFPDNILKPMVDANMLPVICIAIFFGAGILAAGEKGKKIGELVNCMNEVTMKVLMMIIKLTPIGVFCLISKTFAGLGFSAMVPMFKYMGAVLLALVIQCCGVYQILLALLTRLNPLRFLKKFAPVMGFAFSTATSNATIPMNIDTLEEKIGVNRRISSFTIPLGATINMDGTSIMQGVAVVFVAQAFGIQLSPADYLTVIATATLASIGTAGVPSVGLVTLAMVFDSVGLPVAGIGLIMGIDRILDMARTAVNITGDAICTTIVAHQDGALDKSVFNKN